ncbi:MAG: hypothetical protein COU31_03435 [Candidatus Magasanikbacteria bacterium CG10_big_fil_rev_8_21_14_0_10_40_10]|uniref:PIN domain-containing protein n=1 Tax=Candidatus Magasanikbacteria bacterium CG10_big_fil_rev_8_21_14_0_10_40_10 TaxID=1974648 RepID=A0A2M6W3P4_9BACT|nr:MAG: hypothetical protein COU31_03435 [Candidatus Magasanikbacteria bacterium CG10_big_fil_rev_8_21_14_0_10_40_10]
MAGKTGYTRVLRYFLIDTCLLIKGTEDSNIFFNFYNELNIKYQPVFLIHEGIKFEFLRSAVSADVKQKREELLNILDVTVLPQNKFDDDILQIAQIYHANKVQPNQIHYIDVINAAILNQFAGRVHLLTIDNNDYPPCLFNYEEFFSMEKNNQRSIVGEYIFSKEKYHEGLVKLAAATKEIKK